MSKYAMLGKWYGIMPNKVLLSNDLTDKQKILFCAISSLCAEKWFCWASNEYLWDFLWCHKITISKNIARLQELWFIEVEILDNHDRKIRISESANEVSDDANGVSADAKGGLALGLRGVSADANPYIYEHNYKQIITREYLFQNFYWANKWIDEGKCNKIIDEKLKQWITLEDIWIGMVLYNSSCRLRPSSEYKYVKKLENWLREFHVLNKDTVEEELIRIITEHRRKKEEDSKYNPEVWERLIRELSETFGQEKVNKIFKAAKNKLEVKFT